MNGEEMALEIATVNMDPEFKPASPATATGPSATTTTPGSSSNGGGSGSSAGSGSGSWTPSISAQPFYPQQSFPLHPHQMQPFFNQNSHHFPPQPYFDPQWAYHNMLIQQQLQQGHQQPASAPAPSPGQVFFPQQFIQQQQQQQQQQHDHQLQLQHHQSQLQQQQQYPGFHPYRRPNRPSNNQSPQQQQAAYFPPPGPPGPGQPLPFQQQQQPPSSYSPPYARPDDSGSSSSVNSATMPRSSTSSPRSTHSSISSSPSTSSSSPVSPNSALGVPGSPPLGVSSLQRPTRPSPLSQGSTVTASSNGSPSTTTNGSGNDTPTTPSARSPTSTGRSGTPTGRPVTPTGRGSSADRGSGGLSVAEKRMSRDDSDLAQFMATPGKTRTSSSGLKGRLRRSGLPTRKPPVIRPLEDDEDGGDDGTDGASTATGATKKSRRSLFSRRLNASTDNISLSSTVSSASVMIRKLGSMGRLARRNSLAGITSLFKDKEKKRREQEERQRETQEQAQGEDEFEESGKAEASVATVSHVTAELDRMGSYDEWSSAPEMAGLSPAAKLARQHTLRSAARDKERAEMLERERERQRQLQEQQAREAAEAAAKQQLQQQEQQQDLQSLPMTWEMNTATRSGAGGTIRVNEDGTRVFAEDDEDEDDDEAGGAVRSGMPPPHRDAWDEDEDWEGDEYGEDGEDTTIRQDNPLDDSGYSGYGAAGPSRAQQYAAGYTAGYIEENDDTLEPWAIGVRRSVEKTRRPTKGILKSTSLFEIYLNRDVPGPQTRARSNSYNSHHSGPTELGPLARIPSPDPDHIDGLHRRGSHSSSHATGLGDDPVPMLPPLAFESNPKATGGGGGGGDWTSAIYLHANSSAPTLSTLTGAPQLAPRSASQTVSKRIVFANNLSVYDTFPASVYDRTSDPATWSRLMPQLANTIKEELNSYKMEEMEVHQASRMHTQFFV
ncbi:hypothetical protein FISHEDRAFT_66851 [Fistulina hepatica ATCC 64428]|uniref:Uncharacterized protein n=1 Tax=Fistulina hepatica ATCC 64428 TaxID=1128425 RepID=A0A0D7A630_9AGAR|nr:hypothetical protein FISHEDRAFT_66851 [Fistulina hepatica ATCC 64428]